MHSRAHSRRARSDRRHTAARLSSRLAPVARATRRRPARSPMSPPPPDVETDVETADGVDYDDPECVYDDATARDALRLFVERALDEHRGGANRARYYELLDATRASARGEDDGAVALVDALGKCATLIDASAHEELVRRALVGVDLWACGAKMRATATRFGTQLVCAQGGAFSGGVVGKLVDSFCDPRGRAWWRDDRNDDGAAMGEDEAEDGRVVAGDLTRALGNILRLVPQSERAARKALRAGVPHKTAPKDVQIGFMRAAFALVESEDGAGLRDDFLKVVVAHLLEVDVEIKWDDVMSGADRTSADRGAAREEEEDDAMFELDDIEKTIEEQCRAEWEQRPTTSAPLAVDEAADTLDGLMELALAHIDKRCDSGETDAVRQALMHAFYRHAASRAALKVCAVFSISFVLEGRAGVSRADGAVVTKLTDVSVAGSIRLAAAAYFASFLARAKHLKPEFVCELLRRLVDWCLVHVKQRTTPGSAALSGAMEKTKVGMPPPVPHQTLAVFDSACQAAMYVLCYRAEDIMRAEGSSAMTLRSLPLCEVLYSHLRPLSTCLPSVVTEFLHRAVGASMNGFTQVLLKEHMDRMATGRETDVSSNMPLSRQNSMEFTSAQVAATIRATDFRCACSFPFDPYLLTTQCRTASFGPDTYVFWTGRTERGTLTTAITMSEDEDDGDMNLSSDSEDSERRGRGRRRCDGNGESSRV